MHAQKINVVSRRWDGWNVDNTESSFNTKYRITYRRCSSVQKYHENDCNAGLLSSTVKWFPTLRKSIKIHKCYWSSRSNHDDSEVLNIRLVSNSIR